MWRHILVRNEVQPFVELRGLPGRFDLVTSFSTLLDRPPQGEPAIWIENAREVRTNKEPDGDEVSALYRDLPYLEAYSEAYSRYTDLRVRSDPQQAIGGHWEALGKLQFDYLVANGLKPGHRLLDIGCGTLRGGRHFIRYLAPGGYTGIDISNGRSRAAGNWSRPRDWATASRH